MMLTAESVRLIFPTCNKKPTQRLAREERKYTAADKALVLSKYKEFGSVKKAAIAAKINESTAKFWVRKSKGHS